MRILVRDGAVEGRAGVAAVGLGVGVGADVESVDAGATGGGEGKCQQKRGGNLGHERE